MDFHFRNLILYLGHGLGIVDSISELCCACWLGLGWDWTFPLEVRLCTSMFVVGSGLDIPFRYYFGMMDMGCGLDMLF